MRKNFLYIFMIFLLVGVLIYVESSKKKPIDWRISYSNRDKIPYGGFLLYELLGDVFVGQKVEKISQTVYQQAIATRLVGENINYLFVSELFNPTTEDTRMLFDFVENGGNVFVAAEMFEGDFGTKLALRTSSHISFNGRDSIELNFTSKNLKAQKNYLYKNNSVNHYFVDFDKSKTAILATNQHNEPVYMSIKFGKGHFWVSSSPIAFTNYNIVSRNNAEFVAKSWSFLPNQHTLWDEYYKYSKYDPVTQKESSLLRVIKSKEAIDWAFNVLVATILLLIFFMAKRKQRPIPIIIPPKNTTLEFADTIGVLYFQNKDHKNLALKKINFLFTYIRTKLSININEPNLDYVEKIAQKAAKTQEDVQKLFLLIQQIQQYAQISDNQLISLNAQIKAFKK